jgi:hypothetical protein
VLPVGPCWVVHSEGMWLYRRMGNTVVLKSDLPVNGGVWYIVAGYGVKENSGDAAGGASLDITRI